MAELRALRSLVEEVQGLMAGRQKELLTVTDVAERTGRSPYTVRRWIAEGLIEAIRVDGTGPRGRLLIRRANLERLLQLGRGQHA